MDAGDFPALIRIDPVTNATMPRTDGPLTPEDIDRAATQFQSLLIYRILCAAEESSLNDGGAMGLKAQGLEYFWMTVAEDMAEQDALGLKRTFREGLSQLNKTLDRRIENKFEATG